MVVDAMEDEARGSGAAVAVSKTTSAIGTAR